MNLIYKKPSFSSTKPCLASIGVFDGVHLGHQYLLNQLKAEAVKRGKPSLVISFDFPPEKVLNSGKKFSGYITDYTQKASLIESLGIDFFWVLAANRKLFKFRA